MKTTLTPAHYRFTEHYATHSNATQAYLHAYPRSTYATAKANGFKLLANTDINNAIQKKKEELALKYNITKERIISELIDTSEIALRKGNYNAYASLMNTVIRMLGYFVTTKIDNTGEPVIIKIIATDGKG
ncbi:MAG TPA: terminase small subunit [Bacteroidia bacterium]|jgi:phage terminase small subunit